LAAAAAGCAKKSELAAAGDSARTTVYAVNYPLAYFAERLSPDAVDVRFEVPAGVDPAFWEPAPASIAEIQTGGLILLNGAGYARWTRYATLPSSRTVVTARGCRDAFLPSGETLKHQHGPEGEHVHGDTAFTTWLDLGLARCQAGRVRDALVDSSPSDRSSIEARAGELDRDLAELHAALRRAAKPWGNQPVLASHPVYQYLADAYGLRIESVHFEPEQSLDEDDLRTLDDLRKTHPATLMLWEAAPLDSTKAALGARGITAVVFDPCADRPSEGDFLSVMRSNVKRLACATGAERCE
jgi:zinc transport system substrate-binding protein